MVNLNRSPEYTGHNIPIDPNNYYRGLELGAESDADFYEGLWAVNEDGEEVMKGHGKGGSDRLSFQAGHINDLYVNKLVKADTIVEGTAGMPIDHQDPRSGYTFVNEIKREEVESGETPLRVYVRRPLGGGAIHLVNDWEKVFDSFPDEPNDSSGDDYEA